MAKKIKHEDLIQKNVLAPTIEQANLLLDALNAVEDQIIDLVKTSSDVAQLTKSFGDSKDIEKLNKATKDIAESEAVLLKTRKEKVALEQQLAKLDAEQIKTQQQQLKLDIQNKKEQERLEKQQKKELKTAKQLDSSYKRQSKRLNDLRNQYKDLAAENKQGEKATQELLKEIQKLDKELKDIDASVGQFQRSVGDYSQQALGSTKATLGFAAALVGLSGGLDDVKTAANANEEGSKELSGIVAQAGAVFNTFANRAGKAGTSILDFTKEVVSGDKSIFDFSETLNIVVKSFEGSVDASLNAANAAKIASDAQFELDRSSLSLNEQLVKLNGEFERQSAIAGDTTKTFEEQQTAAEEAERVNIRRLAIQRDLAKDQLEIIKINLEGAEEDANKLALETEASEKRIELQELQNELDLATIENDKVLREIQRDRFERNLDFAIDAFDAQKTLNERLIADDRKSIEERSAILDETKRLAESSFQSQKDLFAEFVDDRVDFDALVAETDEAAIRRTLFKLNLDDVELGRALEVIKERKIALQDLDDADREVSEAIQERVETRLAAVDETENILRQRQIDRLNAEIDNEETSNERKIELIKERTSIQEEVLRNEANTLLRNDELLAEERVVIEEQLINDLANLEQEKVDAVKEANAEIIEADKEAAEKRTEQALETANQIKDAFESAIDDEFSARSQAIDDEIAQREKAVDFNRQLAIEGNTEAAEQLQFEQEQLAKAAIKKKQLAEQEAQAKRAIQIVDAYFAAFERRISDPETPAGQAPVAALGDVAKGVAISEVAKALVSASFINGTENVEGSLGKGSQFFSDKVDNYLGLTSSGNLIRFDGQERILNPNQNKAIGGLSNDELTQLAVDYNNGNLRQPYEFQTASYLSSLGGITGNVKLEMKVAAMASAIDRNAETIASAINNKPVAGSYINSALEVVEEIKKNGRTKRTIHKRF